MGFFDVVRRLNPFKSKTSATEGRLAKLSNFQKAVAEAVPFASPVVGSLPTWDQQQLDALTGDNLETPQDALDAFLHFGVWLPVTSSNVQEIHYDSNTFALQIRFKNGGLYQYEDVSVREAESFAKAASPGGWVWDNLRVRGKVFAFNRAHPYTFLSEGGKALGGYEPQWYRSAMTRRLHGQVPDTGAQNKAIFKRLMPKRGPFSGKQH